jgi:hypothetical protein
MVGTNHQSLYDTLPVLDSWYDGSKPVVVKRSSRKVTYSPTVVTFYTPPQSKSKGKLINGEREFSFILFLQCTKSSNHA